MKNTYIAGLLLALTVAFPVFADVATDTVATDTPDTTFDQGLGHIEVPVTIVGSANPKATYPVGNYQTTNTVTVAPWENGQATLISQLEAEVKVLEAEIAKFLGK